MAKPTSGGAGGSGGRQRASPIVYRDLNGDTPAIKSFIQGEWARQKAGINAAIQREIGQYQIDSWINDALRKPERAIARYTKARIDKQLAALDSAVNPLTDNIVTYRGTDVPGIAALVAANGVQSMVGKRIDDKAFISTSLDRVEAFNHVIGSSSDASILRIRAPKGTKGIFANPNGRNGTEREFILDRNSSLRIVAIDQKGSFYEIEAEVVQG